ncbi:MAG: hypothetical protein ABI781_14930 [Burkholderiales bacterium]
MNASRLSSSRRQRVLVLSTLAALVLSACDKAAEPPAAPPVPVPDAQTLAQPVPAAVPVARAPAASARAVAAAPAPAAHELVQPYYDRPQAVYTEYRAPISQPAPIAVPWAPPAMLLESIPPQPSPDSNWTGGYWVWRQGWVWAPGYWATPPRPRYHWVPPYYEHRQDRVVFVDGFWSPPDVGFVRPAAGATIALAVIGAAFAVGHAPVGPEGIFVPPPPGSRPGLLVPAPIGTAPAVVVRAPAIIAPGMRVSMNVNNIDKRVDNSVHNNVRNTTINNSRNTTIVNNINNVTIEAPATATLNHQAVRVNVPSQPHLAAAAVALAPPVQAPRVAGPAPPDAAQHVDESAMKRPLPVTRSTPPATATAPQMHAERAAAPEPHRAIEAAPARPPQHAVPEGRPAMQAQEQRPARPAAPAPPSHPAPAAAPAAHAESAHAPAQQPAHMPPAAHPAAEKPKPNEAAHKPNGEASEEKGRKEREPR